METFNREDIERMRSRVEAMRGFYMHLIIYFLVNTGLAILNIIRTPEKYWFQWAALGWGIGLLSHWWGVFGARIFFSRAWEERKIRELLEKEKQGNERKE
jgi:hypothetical protein